MLPDPFNAHVDVSGGTPTTKPFTILSTLPNGTVRQYAAAPAGEPKVLKISHSTVGKGVNMRDRHLVRLESYVVEDTVENPAKPVSAYMVLDIPRVGVTATQKSDLFKRFVGLLRGASGDAANAGDQTNFWDRLWLGES